MNSNQDRVTRAQRRRIEDEDEYQGEPAAGSRRRRSQAARLRQETDGDAYVAEETAPPPSKEALENRRKYGRPQQEPTKPPAKGRRGKVSSLYEDEYEEEEFGGASNDYDVYSGTVDVIPYEAREKRHVLRWVIVALVILSVLAGITMIGLKRPDLVEPVVSWGRELIYGPTPSPTPSPTPAPSPSPTPIPPPDVSEAIILGFLVNPVEDISQPVVFQVSTTQQTDRVQIVDDNGQILIEGVDTYTDTPGLRIWTLNVIFEQPYDGGVEVYPGNEAGWNYEKYAQDHLTVGNPAQEEPQAEPTPESQANPVVDSGAVAAVAVPVTAEIYVNKERTESFAREFPISMGDAAQYKGENGMNGVLTYRSGGMRQNAAYGLVAPVEMKLESVWSTPAGLAGSGSNSWSTQPLIVQWHANILSLMELTAEKQGKGVLKEVIFPANDGSIYFLDLDDGVQTRVPLRTDPALPMLGAAAVYPKGYPLLAVGTGDPAGTGDRTSLLLYNLMNFSLSSPTPNPAVTILNQRDEAKASGLSMITAPLFDNGADALMAIGGNGLLYTLRLGTALDPQTMTMTVSPKLETYATVSGDADMSVDSSLAAYGENAYFATNGGILQCVNLNTLQTVWAVGLGTDVDGAVALDAEEGAAPAVYVGTVMDASGQAHMLRLDGDTGAVRWDVRVPGSVSASPLVGANSIASLVIFTARNDNIGSTVYALDKASGQIVWQQELVTMTASSPVALYSEDGGAWIVQGEETGLHLLSGQTGEKLDSVPLGGAAIGSPAVFNDMIVVATQDGRLNGIRIK